LDKEQLGLLKYIKLLKILRLNISFKYKKVKFKNFKTILNLN